MRELQEEVGVTADESDLNDPLVYFYPADDGLHERVSVFFSVTNYLNEPTNAEPSKADESGWFAMDNLPDKMVPLLKRAVLDYAAGVRYSERYYDKRFISELVQ